ncbi:uncharacterized protein SPAPADRAFT_138892 [Spathaspora passalidarum NRRL Y-27907]|uniref:Replication factor A protein 3 n=1 Tax=Spathaspora passalidarum (strain NRRL Y-27907 / 11-Y1) TaxID=619300 RepID=G3APZ9_SPAPN|nr:uncharacterized protein SPAPADRAFT_138892 [Spathaspora passalidarum NRRL Y-27907]EGW32321.1 hypothetical protein SPAPADRAFT_138892 [Spathaspora passalidarum NRRL Y-27907]
MENIKVDSTLLASNQNKVVSLFGKCESYDQSSNTAIVISNGPVKLELPEGEPITINKNYEIIGKATGDSSVRVFSVTELTDNFNLDLAHKLVHYTHKVPELFYTS